MCYSKIRKGNYVSYNHNNYKVVGIIKDQNTGEDVFYKLKNYPRGGWIHISQINYIDISVLLDKRRLGKVMDLLNNRQYPQFKYIHEFQNAYKDAYGRPWNGAL